MPGSAIRLDKRGRRIGRNWWREWIVGEWFCAHTVWLLDRDSVAKGYEFEEREYARDNPQPTLKHYMIALADPERSIYG